jgi:uncharacterized protein YecE (DUF72 family)/YHS domain-containing protein
MSNLSLFEDPAPSIDRGRLARTLAHLAGDGIYIGTSSWKYEGWIGQVYSREPYLVRGRHSKARFEERCIAEYAKTFPVVCGDFSFYQFPSDTFWQKLFAHAPQHLQWAFKVPEEITCRVYPTHPRYGPRAGQPNETFLSVNLLETGLLRALEPFRERIAVLIFEFGTFSRKSYADAEEFCTDLDAFLSALPSGWRYAVEIRNEEFLTGRYFETLAKHGVAHVFNAWTRMPPLHRQIAMAEAWTAEFAVVRALLRTGRAYETAVQMFSPYTEIQDSNPKARQAMRDVIARSKNRRVPAYLFINNRLEGNAPMTIDAVVHGSAIQDEEEQHPISMQRDHVCGRKVDEQTAPAKTEYEGDTYYFDSEECKRKFEEDPESYVSRTDASQS